VSKIDDKVITNKIYERIRKMKQVKDKLNRLAQDGESSDEMKS
jgi:hypothetical protein